MKVPTESQNGQTISAPQMVGSAKYCVTSMVVSQHPQTGLPEAHKPEHSVTLAWQSPSPTKATSSVVEVSSTSFSSQSFRTQPQAVKHEPTPSRKASFPAASDSRASSDDSDLVRSENSVRLVIADDQRETSYMNTIRLQRSRVLKIRRCIAAATLIQRAWRKYKQRT